MIIASYQVFRAEMQFPLNICREICCKFHRAEELIDIHMTVLILLVMVVIMSMIKHTKSKKLLTMVLKLL